MSLISGAGKSSCRVFTIPYAINSKITAIGRPATIDAVCRALNPPASIKTPATTPEVMPQKNRNLMGGCSSPIESIVHITNVPESEDVTNHETSKIVTRTVIGIVSESYPKPAIV